MISSSIDNRVRRCAIHSLIGGGDDWLTRLKKTRAGAVIATEHRTQAGERLRYRCVTFTESPLACEQRERKIAQYDQQIQALQLEQRRLQDALTSKQVEAGELAKEGARMAVELAHTRKTLRDALKRNEALQQVTPEAEQLGHSLAEREGQLRAVNDALSREQEAVDALQTRVQTLEPEIVALKASARAYEVVLARLYVGGRNGAPDLGSGAQGIPTVNAQLKAKAKRGDATR